MKILKRHRMVKNKLIASIDPASGGSGSATAVSYWEWGKYQYTITIEHQEKERAGRLGEILKSLMKHPLPQLVFVELVPPYLRLGNGMTTVNLSLHKSIGVIEAWYGLHHVPVIQVPVATWKKVSRVIGGYEKTDVWDSVCIGLAGMTELQDDVDFDLNRFKELVIKGD